MAHHELYASIRATLPDDPVQMAEIIGKIGDAWAGVRRALAEVDAKEEFAVGVTQVTSTQKRRRTKPPRIVSQDPVPQQAKLVIG